MTKNSARFAIAALACGILFNYLFFDRSVGISFALFMTFLAVLLIALTVVHKERLPLPNIILIVASLLLALFVAIRDEPFGRFGAGVASVALMWLASVTLWNANWRYFRFLDYAKTAFHYFLKSLTHALGYLFPQKNQTDDAMPVQTAGKNTLSVLRGLLLALPIIFILAMLLSSADPVFEEKLRAVFDINRSGEYVGRLIIIAIISFIALGTLLFINESEKTNEQPDPTRKWFKPILGWIESSIILGGVVLLFAVFVVIQFQYFFGGNANIHINGYTYAEYARRGFSEMIIVSFLVLALYMALSNVSRQDTDWQRTLFKVLSVLMNGLVLVILYSAFLRMNLYQDAYGFSRARMHVYAAIFWLAVLLLTTIVLELSSKRHRFPVLFLITLIGLAFTLVVPNIDGYVVRMNVDREIRQVEMTASLSREGGWFDANYLRLLSWDAVPAIYASYQRQDISKELKLSLQHELACRTQEMKELPPQRWQETQLGRAAAYKLLRAHEAQWSGYEFTRTDFNDLNFKYGDIRGSCAPDILD